MKYHVISHTHWDREWYEPFEQFRIRLVSLIDNLLKLLEAEKKFIFHMDAQTSVLEDYLKIKPHNKNKLKKYISKGRILIGPWYVQNDFYLTSGEATVRNLLIGSELAEEFGKCDKAGYAPDQFGLISQLPQILNQFGIDNCIFGRGIYYNTEKNDYEGIPGITRSEFYWKGEDGSKVIGIHMPFWYNNAQRFSEDINKSLKYLESIKQNSKKVTKSKDLLLMNGVDHLEAQENLLPILKKINNTIKKKDTIKQSTLCDYVKEIHASNHIKESIEGELRYGHELSILHGTLSSRAYLKIANVKAQNSLEKQLEPIMTMCVLSGFGYEVYENALIKYLWKLLLKNHPHDSICGCSRDAVHRHMLDRFERLSENIAYILPSKYSLITHHIKSESINKNSYVISAFNTLPYKRSAVVETMLEFPEEEKVDNFTLSDINEKEINFEILEICKYEKALRSPVNLPGKVDVDAFKAAVYIKDIPAMGYKTLFVKTNTTSKSSNKKLNFENKYLKINVNNDGSIDLTDKKQKKMYNDILYIEDREDCGDSYIYKSSPKGLTVSSKYFTPNIKCTLNNSIKTEYQLTYKLLLPESFDFSTMTRSKNIKENILVLRLSLSNKSKKFDIAVHINNQSKDHRIRAVFDTNILSDYTTASIPFDVQRKNRNNYWIEKREFDKSEAMTDFTAINNENFGIAILTEGLHSYEHLYDGKIAVTLMRSNGYIHTWDGIPRDTTWIAPENQCIGDNECRLAILPYNPKNEINHLSNYAQEFLTPILTHFNNINPKKFTGGRPCVQDSELTEIFYRSDPYAKLSLPSEKSLLRINNKNIVLTALKKAEKNDTVIIRCYNSSSEKQQLKIKLGFIVNKAFKINMSESGTGKLLATNTNTIKTNIKQKEIVTIEIYPA